MLAGLRRLDDWVFGGMVMVSRMLVFAGIAAAHVAADQTQSQMNPVIARFKAVFTANCVGSYVANLFEVRAMITGHYSSHW